MIGPYHDSRPIALIKLLTSKITCTKYIDIVMDNECMEGLDTVSYRVFILINRLNCM